MPDNNFYLLRENIHNDYLENYVWSKCGRKYGFEAIDHSNKSLYYNTLHYTCGRVVEIFRKQKFYGFQVRKPYRLFKTIVVSIITFFKRDSSIIRFLIVPNSVQLKLCVTDNNITVFKKQTGHFLFHRIIFDKDSAKENNDKARFLCQHLRLSHLIFIYLHAI